MSSPLFIDEAQARLDIVHSMRRLWERGLIAAGDGNASVRLDDNRLLITPSGLLKSTLRPEQLLVIDHQGQMLQGDFAPSSEWPMHVAIYAQRPEAKVVLHAHPPYAVALSLLGLPIAPKLLPEVAFYLGEIPTAPYATPGSRALSEQVAKFILLSQAVVLERHGAVSCGPDLDAAYGFMEVLEHAAKVNHLALQLDAHGVSRAPEKNPYCEDKDAR